MSGHFDEALRPKGIRMEASKKKSTDSPQHLSREAGLSLVDAWRQSGKTQAAFCEEHSVSVACLRYWVARAPRPPSATDFFVVVPEAEDKPPSMMPSSSSSVSFEVQCREVTVRMPTDGFQPELFLSIVRLLTEEVRR